MENKKQNKNDIVKQYIYAQIDKQLYRPGQIIDSESQLCELLKVSRMTVRKALDELVGESIVYKEKGRGTFVARKPKYAEFQCGVAFTKEVLKRGMVPTTKDSTLELLQADEDLAKQLHIEIGDKIWKVTRVRCADNEPILYAVEYYVYALCNDLTLNIVNKSIYNHLEDKGITFAFLDQKLEAIICDKLIAPKLQVEVGHPLILMSLIAYMKNGIPFNCGIEYYRTDKYTLIQSIYNNGE